MARRKADDETSSNARQNYLLKSGMGTVAAVDYEANPDKYDVVEETQEQHDARIEALGRKTVPVPPKTTIANLHTFDSTEQPVPVANEPGGPAVTQPPVTKPVATVPEDDGASDEIRDEE